MIEPVQSILIVDDEPANLLALEATLEPLGHTLIRAASGEEALRKALMTDFAVVLLDVQMPGMDGFECAELLRKRPRTRDVPIIFLTAISKDRAFVQRGYGVGAVDYLFKPYEPDVLRSKVSVFVELEKKNAIIRAQHEALRAMSQRELAELKQASEQRYVHLADAMPLLVWTSGPDGAVSYANRRFRELAGDARVELTSVLHPDDVPRFLEGWQAALARGTEWEAELRFGSPSVGFRVHLVRAVPWRDADGLVAYWLGTSTDIHGRVRAERAVRMLADASRNLAVAFEAPPQMDAVLRAALPVLGDAAQLDVEGDGLERRCIGVAAEGVDTSLLDDPRFELGPSTVRYTQRSEVYLDVHAELEHGPSSRRSEHLRFLAELGVTAYMCVPLTSRRRSVGTLTFVRTRPGGKYVEGDVTLVEDLASRLAVAIDNARLHDVTEKRRLELEQANRSKDVFLATLSHELRTPLNAIVGWTDMLRSGQLGEDEIPRAAETIDRNAHALSSLVADLLDVSRIVTGTLKLDAKLLPLASVVEAAIEAARPQCSAKEIRLEVSLERIGCVRGDGGRLRQVFGNLLSNAIKFTPAGGTVAVTVERQEEGGRVTVRDSGEGITAEFLPHVFERFRQAENARTRGLGLGLAIVKHLIEEHGGSVTAKSDGPGKGATFAVDLPIAAEESESEEQYPSRPSQPVSGTPVLEGVRVLVVEDDPDGNELITTILERYGAQVTSVSTAGAALEALDAALPDVIVSDIGLPDSDGMELIKAIRAREPTHQLPAIALTAYASRQDAARAITAGFDAHVAKPVQPATLGAALARLLARRAPEVKSQPAA